MKTAISIPDPIFEKGEQIARKLGLTRSALYTRALEELLAREANDKSGKDKKDSVTARVNAFWAKEGPESSELDSGFKRLRARGLPRNDW
jgi:hypothetical protein